MRADAERLILTSPAEARYAFLLAFFCSAISKEKIRNNQERDPVQQLFII